MDLMDEHRVELLRQINVYREAGWSIERCSTGISMFGIGYISSPAGNCFLYEDLRPDGVAPWDVWRDEDLREKEALGRLYHLISDYALSSWFEQEMEKIFGEFKPDR